MTHIQVSCTERDLDFYNLLENYVPLYKFFKLLKRNIISTLNPLLCVLKSFDEKCLFAMDNELN